ncbi:MAG TPA: SDR family NAD(P)-dependent oxidoreductase [Candidatus Sulfotelmatobacter sp.]|jgi:NAD(P)-dependent dehydrogenase (short-subunit alcohol dehydrogenase family)|nr:SDR family NAD(P)-dependent oxidoreductase [Candidatus Sulfotelmatobacter sp.]
MTIDFTDRHVVVTGAAGEMGEAVARALLDAGATVHLPVREGAKARALYAAREGRVRISDVADLTDEAAVAAYYGGLPALWASIHCAGGFSWGRLDDIALAEFHRLMGMNAVSAFLCTREAVKKMRGRGGRIVNVSAQAGVEPRRGAGKVAYAASKAAVAAITLAAAEEVAAEGIWVNAVVPSIIDTAANRKSDPGGDYSNWPKLDEVAATVVFLASPQNFVTRAALVPVYGQS